MAVSFSKDILPLFRKIDIDHMRKHQVLLDDFQYMSDPTGDHANATDVGDRLSTNDSFTTNAAGPSMDAGPVKALPTVDGRRIPTVEGLRQSGRTMH